MPNGQFLYLCLVIGAFIGLMVTIAYGIVSSKSVRRAREGAAMPREQTVSPPLTPLLRHAA